MMSSPPPFAFGYLVYEFERHAYPIGEGTFVIGRDAGSNVVIREPAVSRAHAEVHVTDGVCELRPTGPTGTKINGVPLEGPHTLAEGDRIEIGSAILTFYQSRLPLGVSIIAAPREDAETADITHRRVTITNPILGNDRPDPKEVRPFKWFLPALLVLAVAAYFVFGG